MNTFAAGSTHLDDAELMQLVDGEHATKRAEWDRHVASCAQCSAEAARLRADAGIVRTWLERAAFEEGGEVIVFPAHRRFRRVWYDASPALRAAAVITLLAAPVAAISAIPPLRDWMSGVIAQLRSDTNTLPVQQSDAPPVNPGEIRFVPDAGSFAVVLEAAQAAGSLQIIYGAGSEAALEMTNAAGVVPIAGASGLRIRNAATSSSSYVLRVPVAVTSVTVRIAGRTIDVLAADALRAGAVLSVSGGR